MQPFWKPLLVQINFVFVNINPRVKYPRLVTSGITLLVEQLLGQTSSEWHLMPLQSLIVNLQLLGCVCEKEVRARKECLPVCACVSLEFQSSTKPPHVHCCHATLL